MLVVLCLLAPAWCAALEPGRYEIVAHTVIPHLEENLRYSTTRELRCISADQFRDDALRSMFPVLRHPSLAGCSLAGARGRYALACENTQAATGTARLDASGPRISGTLIVTMGGKNMTFSQHVAAERRGECP